MVALRGRACEGRKSRAAVRALRIALALNPTDTYALGCLGEALRQRKRFKAALCAYGKVVELDQNNPMVYDLIGRTYKRMDVSKRRQTRFAGAWKGVLDMWVVL